ncbi:MAG: hypothetical protein FD180_2472 [Planctomycetota bacterium]|nr:MAG: hypothetical protein FD180_2472 [Planctomycetota bacterium]
MRAMRFATASFLGIVLFCACEPAKPPPAPAPVVAPVAQTDPFTVSFGWTPAVGTREEGVFRTTMRADIKMKAPNGRELRNKADDEFEFAFTEETLKVEGRAPSEIRRKFSKATRRKSGTLSTLGVEGKSLWAKKDFDGAWTWTVEGGSPLADEDYAAMSEGLGRRGGGGGKDGGVVDEAFGSGRPVKVGDTWRPDIGVLARLYVDPDTGVDAATSSATCKLASAEKRGNSIYGTVDLNIDFSVVKIGGGNLNEPLHFVLRGTVTGCLDGSSPDAALKATLSMRGHRTAVRPGTDHTLDIEMDLDLTLDTRRSLAK